MVRESEFYRVSAQTSFTLLGLWWVVAQFKFAEWSRTPGGRRLGYDTSLYFLIPGLMSLISLAAVDRTAVWRTGFAAAGLAAGLNALVGSIRSARRREYAWFVAIAPRVATAAYALIVLVALAPSVPRDMLDLAPLEAEAMLVTIVLILGVHVAWLVLSHVESRRDAPDTGG